MIIELLHLPFFHSLMSKFVILLDLMNGSVLARLLLAV